MSSSLVEVRELVGWELDDYPFRGPSIEPESEDLKQKSNRAQQEVAGRSSHEGSSALSNIESSQIEELFSTYAQRKDLQEEYAGLDWTLSVVDLNQLLAFQRRLVFDPEVEQTQIPRQDDWAALFSFSLGSKRTTKYTLNIRSGSENYSDFIMKSNNPDLQVRLSDATYRDLFPFSLYGGSPFLEVAEFRERWFLRDGYHRTYRLLMAGVHHVPAVVIHARTIDEVGAVQPWFFNEEELFSARPPYVTDFLRSDLVFRYGRQRFIKSIRVRIEESFEPVREASDVSGDIA